MISNCDNVNEQAKKLIDWYGNELIKIYGKNLISIILYGSVLEGGFNVKRSNINIMLIFQTINVQTLKTGLKLIHKGRKKNIIAPLMFTENHIETSCDTFPMEFIEIKENHQVVYGKDPFVSLNINKENLRLQCEQQIKSLIIRLRQSYLEVGLGKKGLEMLLIESLRTLFPILRTFLRYKGEDVSREKEEIIHRVAVLSSINEQPLISLLKDKAGDEKISGKDAEEFFDIYLGELTALAHTIDRM